MLSAKVWILLLVFFVCFFLKALLLDPDLGWHLATGAYVLNQGFPLTDPFSYSMPSYPYVAYAWLTDVFSVLLYRIIGVPGLAFIFAAAAIGSLVLLIPKQKAYLTIPLLLSGSILLFVVGVRPQVFSWLLFALLLLVLQIKDNRKYILLSIIFLFWANIHSSFPLGIFVLAASIFIPAFQKRKIDKKDIGVLVLSFFATLINPYGIKLWEEILLIVTWAEKHTLLLDWYPGLFVPYLPFWISSALSLFFILKYPKQFSFFEKVVFVALVCVGMGAIVDIPYYAVFSFPLLIKGFSLYKEKEKKQLLLKPFLKIALIVIVSIHAVLLYYPKQYPIDAVSFLQKQNVQGNIFADFNWGGYLLWNLPEEKVFVDGHMPHWKLQNPKPNESANAFKEYLAVSQRQESIEKISSKYKINTFIISPGFGDGMYGTYPKVSDQLKTTGWKIVYKDSVAIIYQR